MTIVTVYAVFSDTDEAARIGRAAIEEKLAACVNILSPCQSIYRWQGAIEEATEVPALFKTTTDKAEALVAHIEELHGYDIPAIVVWPIEQALPSYENWVKSELR